MFVRQHVSAWATRDHQVRSLKSLTCEFISKCIHLGEGMLIARAVGSRDAVMQASEGGRRLSVRGHRLSGHLVRGNVVGVVGDAAIELSEGLGNTGLRDEFHGESVASEGIGRGLLENLAEQRELVHETILMGFVWKAPDDA